MHLHRIYGVLDDILLKIARFLSTQKLRFVVRNDHDAEQVGEIFGVDAFCSMTSVESLMRAICASVTALAVETRRLS